MLIGTYRLAKRCTAWFVCLTILMGALLPSAGHMLSRSGGSATLIELCSPSGTRLIALDTGDEPSPAEKTAYAHCIWCSPHASALGPLPSSDTPISTLYPRILILPPRAFHDTPHPLPIWTTTAARGPPLFSRSRPREPFIS